MWTLTIKDNFGRRLFKQTGLEGNVRSMFPWDKLMSVAAPWGSTQVAMIGGNPACEGEVVVKLGGTYYKEEFLQDLVHVLTKKYKTVGNALDELCRVMK